MNFDPGEIEAGVERCVVVSVNQFDVRVRTERRGIVVPFERRPLLKWGNVLRTPEDADDLSQHPENWELGDVVWMHYGAHPNGYTWFVESVERGLK